jgi:hypothetical protein
MQRAVGAETLAAGHAAADSARAALAWRRAHLDTGRVQLERNMEAARARADSMHRVLLRQKALEEAQRLSMRTAIHDYYPKLAAEGAVRATVLWFVVDAQGRIIRTKRTTQETGQVMASRDMVALEFPGLAGEPFGMIIAMNGELLGISGGGVGVVWAKLAPAGAHH